MDEHTLSHTHGSGELQAWRYVHPNEEIVVRIWRSIRQRPEGATGEGLTVAKPVIHTGRYKAGPACLNDVGLYYCAREDRKSCLAGFKTRSALRAHLTHVDENKAPHILVWMCQLHGPEVMFPHDGDEQVGHPEGPIGLSNRAKEEAFQRMLQHHEDGGIWQPRMRE